MTTSSALLRPTFSVTIDGKDMTDRIRPRLCGLTITSSRQDHADELSLTFEDSDHQLALPRRGVTAAVQLGYQGSGVSLQGSFTIDEVEHSGAPDTVSVRGRSAQIAGGFNLRKERSWSKTTIGHVVSVIAGEHKLTPKVAAALASIAITQLDQTESDMALLRRLGREWDAVATVKNGNLLFTPMGRAQTVSGKPITSLTITRSDGDSHRFHCADRDAYTGIRARWHDVGAARGKTVLVGKNGHVKFLRGYFADETEAKRAAQAEWGRVQRGAASFEITLASGRPEVYPEMPVKLKGWKADIEAIEWIVTRATHTLDNNNGFTTHLELENKATAGDTIAQAEADDMDEVV